MAQEIITFEDLQKFRLRLLEDLKELIQRSISKAMAKSSKVRKVLGISHGTLQNLHINSITLPKDRRSNVLLGMMISSNC